MGILLQFIPTEYEISGDPAFAGADGVDCQTAGLQSGLAQPDVSPAIEIPD